MLEWESIPEAGAMQKAVILVVEKDRASAAVAVRAKNH
jgi:hypothetical protein